MWCGGYRLLAVFFLLPVFTAIARPPWALGQTQTAWKQPWDKTVAAARAEAKVVVFGPARQVEWVAQGKYAWLLAPNNAMLHQLAQRGLNFGVLAEFKDYGTHIGTGSGCLS
ncbi:MAG: hypothetical protein ACXWZE_21505, partial [Candidatus Binatia bacterium]